MKLEENRKRGLQEERQTDRQTYHNVTSIPKGKLSNRHIDTTIPEQS